MIRYGYLDGAGLAGRSGDQPASFELDDHLVHARRGDFEEALKVGLGGWSLVQQRVGVNEREVLALLFRESWR